MRRQWKCYQNTQTHLLLFFAAVHIVIAVHNLRVTPQYFDGHTCISSKTEPILTISSKCPCFLRYAITSATTTTWDVLIVEQTSFTAWKDNSYSGDPTDVMEMLSSRRKTTSGKGHFLYHQHENVYETGHFVLVVRTNTDEKVCFGDGQPQEQSQIVFEPMLPACPLIAEKPNVHPSSSLAIPSPSQAASPDIPAITSARFAPTNAQNRYIKDAKLTIATSLTYHSGMIASNKSNPHKPVQARIVGGTNVDDSNSENEFKWMALIWQVKHGSMRPICGGVHISQGYIATAAHCQIQLLPSSYRVTIGMRTATKETKKHTISRVFPHPNFRQLGTQEALNDVTIVELYNAGNIKSAVLPWNDDPEVPRTGEAVTTAGFGYISHQWPALPTPNHLLRVDVPVVSRTRCNELYTRVDGKLHMCAGYEEGGCDSCQSDSGGPLRYVKLESDGTRRAILVGIVSFGSGCAQAKRPGVYTRVSTFADWMEETVVKARESRGEDVMFWNAQAILAVVMAGVAGFALLLFCLVVIFRRRYRRREGRDAEEAEETEQVERDDDGSSIPSETGIST